MNFTHLKAASALTLTLAVAACGGGSNETGTSTATKTSATFLTATPSATTPGSAPATRLTQGGAPALADQPAAVAAVTPAAASQFLANASFGPNDDSINAVVAGGKAAWIDDQFLKPQTLHRDYVQRMGKNGVSLTLNQVFESFWQQAATGDDQLRQRVTYALAQIFVISMVEGGLATRPTGVASYYDMLGQNAFGNFRDLLQGVATHPMMGIYLTYLSSQNESGNRVPDENFAREIMQLMTIGLYKLNRDGSYRLANGKPIETYTHDDVAGLAKVFTGWSWGGPDLNPQRFHGAAPDPARDWLPMQNYPTFHSTSSKSFLGTTIAAGGSGTSDLKAALDTLFNHPNTGPFISRLLIQRLVSSNPHSDYVGRVADVFANNGQGVRGDMRAVIRAILLDPDAGDMGYAKKVREPVLRLANWMRAFKAKSASGRFLLTSVEDPLAGIGQAPLRSPSVFNFYRPSYTPPGSGLAANNMVAPELQIAGEPAVTGYLNYMQAAIPYGIGTDREIKADYTSELALAAQPAALVDRVNLLLLNGMMTTTLRNQIITALNAIVQPAATGANATLVDTARKNRVYMAIFLAMASPEYLAQR